MSEGPTEREQESLRRVLLALATGAPIMVNPILAPDVVAGVDRRVYFHSEAARDRFLDTFGVRR